MRLRRSQLKTIVVLIGAIANFGIRVNVDFRFSNPECTHGWAGELRASDSALHLSLHANHLKNTAEAVGF